MDRRVLAAGMLAWLAAAVIACAWGAPLGHDEAQYALAARDWLAGRPPRWLYLSQGMLAVAAPGIAAGGSELALRIAPLVGGVLFVLAGAQLARRTTTATTAAWVVALMAASVGMVKRSADLLGDMPASAGLLAGAAILVEEVTRAEGPRWRTVLAAPAFAAAFYLRYGSVVPIAIFGAVALAGGYRGIARRPLPVVAAAAAFALLLVPHLVYADARTGSPLGILTLSSGMPAAAYRGAGLVTYLTSNPFTWYGVVTTPVVLLGVASITRLRDRRLVMLWVMAIANVIGLGFTALAQPRYIYVSLVILLVLGAERARAWLASRPRLARAAAGAVAASWLAAMAVLVVGLHDRPARMRATLDAAARVRAEAGGAPCKVVGRHTTQLEWYSGCTAALAPDPAVRSFVVD